MKNRYIGIIKINDKFLLRNNEKIKITKSYGWGTPSEDYKGLFISGCLGGGLGGWIEIKNIKTNEKFPCLRDELRVVIKKKLN